METNCCSADEQLIQQMQALHPERFAVLCRMHLSFLLDLTSEELNEIYRGGVGDGGKATPDCKPGKRIPFLAPLHRKNKGSTNAFDGSSMDSLVKCSKALEALIRFLGREQNICQEGLFRKSGKKSRQQELRGKINSGGLSALERDESDYSVHDCASVLKAYLADLPEPLLSEAHYKAHCQIAGMCKPTFDSKQRETTQARQIQSLQLLFLLLPPENRHLLRELLMLLNRVSQKHNGNLMDAMNLAIMFAPHILCPRKMSAEDLVENSRDMTRAIAFMVENAAELFTIPTALLRDVRLALRPKSDVSATCDVGTSAAKLQLLQEPKMDLTKGSEVTEDDEDPDAVTTVVTFCDRRDTSNEAASEDTTQKALAELYAYVQAMPESLKKKQLIKQFNRETGAGASPLCANPRKHQRSKSLRKTIKKHLFGVGGTSGNRHHQRHRSFSDQNVLPPQMSLNVDKGRPPVHPSVSGVHHYHHNHQPHQRLTMSATAGHSTSIRHPAFCAGSGSRLDCSSKPARLLGYQECCTKPVIDGGASFRPPLP